jgi:hypothetical protein
MNNINWDNLNWIDVIVALVCLVSLVLLFSYGIPQGRCNKVEETKPIEGGILSEYDEDATRASENVTPSDGLELVTPEDTTTMTESEETTTETIPETEPEETIPETTTEETEPVLEDVESVEPTPEETEPISKEDLEDIKPVEPDVDKPASSVTNGDLELLACVIYQETGGDMHCDECRRRVADVVLNRVADDRFPDSIYDVLMQKGQYGRYYWTGIVWPERAKNPYEKYAVERAYRIAEEVLNGQHSDLYNNGYVWQAGFIQGKDNIYCCGHYFGR